MKDDDKLILAMKNIGPNIRRRRHDLDLSQEELANRMNYSPGHISHIECGKCGMGIDALLAFCKELHTDCNSLFMDPREWDVDEERGKAIDELVYLLRGKPLEYIEMVKHFVLMTDEVMNTAQQHREEVTSCDTDAILA